jgi:hypothetical protein
MYDQVYRTPIHIGDELCLRVSRRDMCCTQVGSIIKETIRRNRPATGTTRQASNIQRTGKERNRPDIRSKE